MSRLADKADPFPLQQGTAPEAQCCELSGHVIIAGFGIPGRSVAEILQARGVAYCVIELNAGVVERCAKSGTHIIVGDVIDPLTLERAGIRNARMLAITLPDERAAIVATEQARKMNPTVPIITRCAYTSAGLDAARKGADEVVVGEQVVAHEFSRIIAARFPS